MERIDLDSLDATPAAAVSESPRVVALDLADGERVPPHDHPGEDVLVVVRSGRIALGLDGETHVLEAGEAMWFDGEREVSPAGDPDGTALVVLAAR